MFLLWLRQLPCCGDPTLASVSPPTEGRCSPTTTPVFPSKFLHPTEFCVVLYILSHWSGIPVRSQLVFCMHFCAWRCSPDISVERDVLHVHLLLCHLVLSEDLIFFQERVYSSRRECWMMMEAVLGVRRASSCSTVFLPASIFTHFLSEKKKNISL